MIPFQTSSEVISNIFDDLPVLTAPKLSDLQGELDWYPSSDPKYVPDVLAWWHEHKDVYPVLSRIKNGDGLLVLQHHVGYGTCLRSLNACMRVWYHTCPDCCRPYRLCAS
jgi:hypothetical protein